METTHFLFANVKPLIFLLIICLNSLQIIFTETLNIETDQDALLALKQHIISDPAENNLFNNNWSTNISVCNWTGVSCGLNSQRVTALNLSSMGLKGTIPPHIGNLSFLSELHLTNNSFYGSLPWAIFSITSLKMIDLSRNKLSGSLPDDLCQNLPNLERLIVRHNQFDGQIPSSLWQCPKLLYVSLDNNEFIGEIPGNFGNLTSLQELYLSYNNLTGEIPMKIGSLIALEKLWLANNNIRGAIPSSLSNISTLKTLWLMNNNLEGNIPQEIGNLGNLETLNLYGNRKISGEVPATIFNMSSLKMLELSINNLSGSLPDDICQNLPNLQRLVLHSNQLVGQMPTNYWRCREVFHISLDNNKFIGNVPRNLGNLSSLRYLYLSSNNLKGKIPVELCSLGSLERLWLSDNSLEGSIPLALFNLSSLWDLSLSANALTGKLPSNFGPGFPNLKEIYLWGNQLSGPLPSSISNASKLIILELSSNSFSGPIPNSLGNLRILQRLNLASNLLTDESSNSELNFLSSLTNCKDLRRLVLAGNPLNGTLPTSIGNFSAIQYMNVDSCNIRGSIPSELGLLSNLTTLHLQNNELTGIIPRTIGKLQNLQRLYLQGNKLHGSIPNDICQLKYLGELVSSRNNLSGPLPACLGDVISLRTLQLDSNNFSSAIPSNLWSLKDILDLNLSSNSLHGQLPLSIGNLKVAIQVDLSGNELSGIIPNAFAGLQSLQKLSLADNKLEGPIPESFGSLVSLEYLDLSSNNLSGTIPKSLEQLKYFKFLNLSFNKLEGEVPAKGPFANFSALSFIGNEALCGSPLLQLTPCKISSHGIGSKTKTKKLLVYILLPVIVLITMIIGLVWLRHRRKVNRKLEIMADIVTWRRVTFQELEQATNGFCESNLLGIGGSGKVYKGRLVNGEDVAIKVFNLQLEGALKSFDAECEVMRNIRHRNLVKIVSCCSNNDFKAVVLEYMSNGSLEKWLYSYNYCLNIQQRLNIMIDVASALEYLHHGYSTPIVHCDLKPTNVLLDSNMVAHVADFGIAKLLSEGDSMIHTRTLATIGYMAPEYGSEGIVSVKGDVYSFGILLMETFTRKKPIDDMFGGRMSLRQFIKDEMAANAIVEIIDANLLTEEEKAKDMIDCISSIFRLALDCSVEIPNERIDITEVLVMLKRIRIQLLANLART